MVNFDCDVTLSYQPEHSSVAIGLLIHDMAPYGLKIKQNKLMLPRGAREDLIRPRMPYDGLRRGLSL